MADESFRTPTADPHKKSWLFSKNGERALWAVLGVEVAITAIVYFDASIAAGHNWRFMRGVFLIVF